VKKSFNIQELLHSKSKHHKIKAHAPLLIESFPKTSRIQSESSRFSGSHTYKTKQTTFLHKSIGNELQWIEGHGHLEQFAFVPPIPVNVANCIKCPRSIQSHRSPTPSREFKVVLRNLWCNHPKNNVAKLSYILYMKVFFLKIFLYYCYLLKTYHEIWQYHFFNFFNLETFGQFFDVFYKWKSFFQVEICQKFAS
jgi:hypothetical protein